MTALPNTKLTITLKGTTSALFNGQPITFKNGTATITVPKKAGQYYLTTSTSDIPLRVDVKGTKAVVVPTQTETTPLNPITKLINWVGGWFGK